MAFTLKMPAVGETVTEGTVEKWLKQPGDRVEKYEPIVEINTDKVNVELPSPVTGTIVEILAAIRQLMAPPEPKKKRPIGFVTPEEK